MKLELFHGEVLIGEITKVSHEGFWMSGDLKLSSAGTTYRDFFSFMTDESKGNEEPPFHEDLLDPEKWFIKDGGKNRGIEVPAVHDDAIEWRWR